MKHLRLRLFRSSAQPPVGLSVSKAQAATKAHAAEASKNLATTATSGTPKSSSSTAANADDSFAPPSVVPSGAFSQQEQLNAQQIQLRQHEQKLEQLDFSLSPYADDDGDAGKQNRSSPTTSYVGESDEEGFSVTLSVPESEDTTTTSAEQQKQLPPFRVKPPFLHFKVPSKHQTSLKTPVVDKTKLPPVSPKPYDSNSHPWLSKPFTPFGTPAPALPPPTTSSAPANTNGGISKIERVLDREVRDCDQLWYLVVYAENDSAKKRPRWVPHFYICEEPQVRNFESAHQRQQQKNTPTASNNGEKQDLEAQVLSARAAQAATTAGKTTATGASSGEKEKPGTLKRQNSKQQPPVDEANRNFKRQNSNQPPVFTPTRRKCYQPEGTYKHIDPADTQLSIILPNNLPPIYVVFPRTSRVSDVRQWLRKHVNDLHVEEFVIRSEMPFYRETTNSELSGETLEDSGFSDAKLHVRLVSGGAYGNFDDPYSLCSNSWRTALDYNELMLEGGPVA